MEAKLGNFHGFCIEIPETAAGRSFIAPANVCETPGHTSPELLNGQISTAADIKPVCSESKHHYVFVTRVMLQPYSYRPYLKLIQHERFMTMKGMNQIL